MPDNHQKRLLKIHSAMWIKIELPADKSIMPRVFRQFRVKRRF